mmetsp:Transcript_16275/g.54888  ORF Transcript_16275/g.54888 Transcript_16275/m.54888 type:complete len:375 (+) Transcript_16275:1169-2293(+)
MYAYQILAVKLTNAENWQTDTQFSDKLVFKLCTFNFINSYSPLFYGVFAAQDRCGSSPGAAQGDASACFYDLRYNMIVIFIVAVLSNNVLAYAVPYLSMFRNRLREQGGFSAKAMSPPELEFLMSEYDETLDNITAFQQQAVQYGYVALFSAAFPAAPLLAALNNSLLARMDVYKFLNTYRRIRPFGAEDIGTYQSIFEGLNLAGALSNAGIIVFATPVKVHFSKYNRTVLWICLVTAYFAIVTVIQVALPDVDPDVALQILRSEFINSKIVDRIADDVEQLDLDTGAHVAKPVAAKDAHSDYYDSLGQLFQAQVRNDRLVTLALLQKAAPRRRNDVDAFFHSEKDADLDAGDDEAFEDVARTLAGDDVDVDVP